MHTILVELQPETWEKIPPDNQYVLYADDKMPYPPFKGLDYEIQLQNGDCVQGSVESVVYNKATKQTRMRVLFASHLWDPVAFQKAGWRK